MADNKIPLQPAGNGNPNQHNVVNVNKLMKIFSNPKADILTFSGDHTKDTLTAKYMFDQIRIAKTTSHWSDAAPAENFNFCPEG